MGLDRLGMYTVQLLAQQEPLGKVLTLGRQTLHLDVNELVGVGIASDDPMLSDGYADALLTRHFGASEVDSVDVSGFEGASIVHDLNFALPEVMAAKYDLILDLGTLEHIFDIKTSFGNVARATKVGGRIAHVVPSNGCSGHGLYQFSPEFFYSYYDQTRGFEGTCVFVSSLNRPHYWYVIPKPQNGDRVNLGSRGPLYVVCMTKVAERFADNVIQQSDYLHLWSRDHSITDIGPEHHRRIMHFSGLKSWAKNKSLFRTVYMLMQALRSEVWSDVDLERIDVRKLFASKAV